MMFVVLKDLLVDSRDGEWGQSEAGIDTVEMAVIRGTDFADARVGLLDDVPRRHIPQRIAERKILQPWDILLETAGGSKDRPTGRTLLLKPSHFASSNEPITCASFARYLRVDERRTDPRYLFWLLQHLYNAGVLRKYHTQHTGVARFQYTVFAQGEALQLPGRDVQQRIADVLSAYDDLIENNTKRIKILEEMARSLYREWFVELRFPGHQASGKVAQQLPSGWRLVQVADLVEQGLAQVTTGPFGTQLHASDYVEHGTPVINVRNIGLGAIRAEKLEYVDDATVARLNQHVLADGDIVFGRKGAVERHVLVGRSEVGWLQGSDCLRLRLRANAGTSPRLLSQQFLLDDHKQWMKNQGSHAATMASLNQAIIGRIPVLLPSPEILRRADEELRSLTNLSARLHEANKVLQSTRDLLLPRLLSGEIELHP